MEILIHRRGKDVKLLLAVPGFDATRWPEYTKYSFDLPRAQAGRLGTLLLTLLESPGNPTYVITEGGGVRDVP